MENKDTHSFNFLVHGSQFPHKNIPPFIYIPVEYVMVDGYAHLKKITLPELLKGEKIDHLYGQMAIDASKAFINEGIILEKQ
jgi:hypothetical protein